MPLNPEQKYLIQDPQGNVYGPADISLLREWVGQGRIVPGMLIAERETRQWIEASVHPAVSDLLQSRAMGPVSAAPGGLLPLQTPQNLATMGTNPYQPAPIPVMTPAQDVSVVQYQSETARKRQNLFGLISFIASLTGLVSLVMACVPFCGCFGIPFSILAQLTAVVLGVIALYQIRQNPIAYTGKSLAVTGLTIGSIVLGLFLILAIVAILANKINP